MLFLFFLFFISSDSLVLEYRWEGPFYEERALCFSVEVRRVDRPVYLLLLEQRPGEGWRETSRQLIDRWALPQKKQLCLAEAPAGTRVRLVVRGLSAQAPQAVLYEGYPWGEPPELPSVDILQARPAPLLTLYFPTAGRYLLRCYNRFGEEIFTLPFHPTHQEKVQYALPKLFKGVYLLQLYDLSSSKLLVEKSVKL
ncbi:MAG: hypothetical protein KatS3mg026_1397 [Bacteroidia bacterium]|nr:MAG: hypothetical protein KatS3mg026_1397 [Bacteroidia bacterium]